MSMIVVDPTDPQADVHSFTQALQAARAGDVILLTPGVYSPTRTGEVLPLKIPAEVAVAGAGKELSIIDGEGLFEPSFNPIRPEVSVIVLDDGVTLSGVTVTNGGGHGIGVPPGVSAAIHNCTVSRHGDHGVFLCGVTEAIVTGCVFQENGLKRFEPALPRAAGARQGHHIFAEARHGQRNRLVISDNTMHSCFADGIAFICFFPEADGVSFSATIVRNTIEASERGGLLFSCSFGPSHNRLRLTVTDNILRANKQFGLSIMTAVPLADKVPQDSAVTALVTGNEISASPIGVLLQGAVSEAHHNICQATLDRNRISNCSRNAIRLVGAVGVDGVDTRENSLLAAVSRNSLSGSTPLVVIQGAAGAGNLQQNTVKVRLHGNQGDTSSEQAIMISDGRAGNRAEVLAGSQAHTRTDKDLLR